MNTYIRVEMSHSQHVAAVRASRAALTKARPDLAPAIVPATKALREKAKIGAIPTYVINRRNGLSRL